MALHPNGINHLAISTRDMKGQIEFFTDVLGAELKALYWMHGVPNTWHGFLELSASCYIAFVQAPGNAEDIQLGVTHAGNAGGPVTRGTMQHLALNVDTLDDLYAMRDRLRSRGVLVMGPIDHGMCQSIYFAGPEGLALEITHGGAIDERAWIDPEVQELAGISDEELGRYVTPADYSRPEQPVPQPGLDTGMPLPAYPEKVLQRIATTPDEAFWHSVEHEPPVKVEPR
jgi:catechol 2,3-dioxygenase-like lactoylglutathione lyase family enzyme